MGCLDSCSQPPELKSSLEWRGGGASEVQSLLSRYWLLDGFSFLQKDGNLCPLAGYQVATVPKALVTTLRFWPCGHLREEVTAACLVVQSEHRLVCLSSNFLALKKEPVPSLRVCLRGHVYSRVMWTHCLVILWE